MNAIATIAHLPRDNVLQFQLIVNGEVVPENSVLRAVVAIQGLGSHDSDNSDLVRLMDSGRILEVYPGKFPGLRSQRRYLCKVVLFDVQNPNGVAWGSFTIDTEDWGFGE